MDSLPLLVEHALYFINTLVQEKGIVYPTLLYQTPTSLVEVRSAIDIFEASDNKEEVRSRLRDELIRLKATAYVLILEGLILTHPSPVSRPNKAYKKKAKQLGSPLDPAEDADRQRAIMIDYQNKLQGVAHSWKIPKTTYGLGRLVEMRGGADKIFNRLFDDLDSARAAQKLPKWRGGYCR